MRHGQTRSRDNANSQVVTYTTVQCRSALLAHACPTMFYIPLLCICTLDSNLFNCRLVGLYSPSWWLVDVLSL